MKRALLLGFVVGLLAFTAPAFTYPITLTGGTGLVNQPTAMVIPTGQFNLAADFYNTEKTFGEDSYPIRVLYGVGPNWELGAGFDINGADSDDIWSVNAKYKTPWHFLGKQWAIGGTYQAVDAIDYNAVQAYLVGTKHLMGDKTTPMLNGTFGVNWTRVKFGPTSDNGIRAFVGLGLMLPNKLSLAAEYQTKSNKLNDADPIWGVVARYPITPKLTGQVGVTNGNDSFWAYAKAKPFAGLNYNF